MQTTEAYRGSEQSADVRIQEKETREIQGVLSRSLPSFYRRAYRYLGNAADAEDALLSAYRNLDQFRGQAQMSMRLTTIVTNSALTQLRADGHIRPTCR